MAEAKKKTGDEIKADPEVQTPTFGETLKELKRHIDPNLIREREGWRDRSGNINMVSYVEWHTVADILDERAPNWIHAIKDIRQIGDLMTVTVAITIDGITREGIGTGAAQNEMGIKKAEHDALKRAAVKFGVARELYKKESDVIEREGSAGSYDQSNEFPANPIARSLGEIVTSKQLSMIRAIARELNIDPDEECNSVMNCSTDEITKRAASALIQHLQGLQADAGDYQAAPRDKPPLRLAQQPAPGSNRQRANEAVAEHANRDRGQAPYLKPNSGDQPRGAVKPNPIKLPQPMINKLRMAIKKADGDESNMAVWASEGRVEQIEYLTSAEAEKCLAEVSK